jgi:hypothetical protein
MNNDTLSSIVVLPSAWSCYRILFLVWRKVLSQTSIKTLELRQQEHQKSTAQDIALVQVVNDQCQTCVKVGLIRSLTCWAG